MSVAAGGMAASLVPAYIQCFDPPVLITFPYNPKAYTIEATANWKTWVNPANPDGTLPQWGGIKARRLDVEILLDLFSVPPIPPSEVIEELKLLMKPTMISDFDGSAVAPTVTFGWGANIIMTQAVVVSVREAHTRFTMGEPVRTTVTVQLLEVPLPAPLGATNPTSGGLTTRRSRTVVEGDTLASIAHQEYRNPNMWRALAEVNNIHDPMRLKEGTVLFVPERREAEALS